MPFAWTEVIERSTDASVCFSLVPSSPPTSSVTLHPGLLDDLDWPFTPLPCYAVLELGRSTAQSHDGRN